MRVTQAMTVICPRCGATVSTEYKYCPECAFRLRAGLEEEPAAPPQSLWPHVLLLLGAITLIGLFVLAGVALFGNPDEDLRPPPIPTVDRGRLTVSDLGDSLVTISEGIADWQPDVDPESGEPRINPSTGEAVLLPVITAEFRVSRHETTRGQWAEFLADIEAQVATDPDALFKYAPRDLFDPLAPRRDSSGNIIEPFETLGDWVDTVDASLTAMWSEIDRVSWCQGYADRWWLATEQHLREHGVAVDRPAGLRVPLDPSMRHLLLAPPGWIESASMHWMLGAGTENHPVTGIAFPDTITFAIWATEQLGIDFYLPTRAEFLRAYHGGEIYDEEAGTGNRWPWGPVETDWWCNSLGLWGDTEERLLNVTHLLGHRVSGLGNGLSVHGLYHMAGNAREWTEEQELVRREYPDPQPDRPRFYFMVQTRRLFSAPTLGGSYRLGIEECDYRAVRYVDVRAREDDIGFRLVARARPF